MESLPREFQRPNPQRHIPALSPGAGPFPWTAGFDDSIRAWTDGWRREVGAFESAVRTFQKGLSSADFGAVQLQGFGSTKNYDYVANRWQEMAGHYIVGAGEDRKMVSQGDGSYRVTGLDAWLIALDEQVRLKILEALDRRVAPWFYRAAFHDDMTLSVKVKKKVWMMPDGKRWAGPGAVLTEVEEMEKRTYDGWPVWSGYSRSQLAIEWQVEPSELRVRIRSRAPYTLAAPATRAAWYNLRRKLRELLTAITAEIGGDMEKLHA
jgi:hypothetical protein